MSEGVNCAWEAIVDMLKKMKECGKGGKKSKVTEKCSAIHAGTASPSALASCEFETSTREAVAHRQYCWHDQNISCKPRSGYARGLDQQLYAWRSPTASGKRILMRPMTGANWNQPPVIACHHHPSYNRNMLRQPEIKEILDDMILNSYFRTIVSKHHTKNQCSPKTNTKIGRSAVETGLRVDTPGVSRW